MLVDRGHNISTRRQRTANGPTLFGIAGKKPGFLSSRKRYDCALAECGQNWATGQLLHIGRCMEFGSEQRPKKHIKLNGVVNHE